MNTKSHLVLAYYHFIPIEKPLEEVALHKKTLSQWDITCRVYISEEGINGQLSGTLEAAEAYMQWMQSRKEFSNIWFKVQPFHENVFPRKTIKYRKQLVALDTPVDLKKTGTYLQPSKWKEKLKDESQKVILDVRNDYEWEIGHFEGARKPGCETFRDFNRYANELKESVDPEKTPVMMYCTGGIRCELYSAVLKEKGFKEVYQLEGGIINYSEKEGSQHWLGKLFVFDDRLAISMDEENEAPVIGECFHCKTKYDAYYNCANMDCNKLFICCPICLEQYKGCCQENCKHAKRVRPYQQCTHKPFKKWYHYQ